MPVQPGYFKPYSAKGFPAWVQNLDKAPRVKMLLLGVGTSLVISQILSTWYASTVTLPATITPENEAKHVAWMKFNNINPIFGK